MTVGLIAAATAGDTYPLGAIPDEGSDSLILGVTVDSAGNLSGGIEAKANGVVQPQGWMLRTLDADIDDPDPQTTSVDSLLDGEIVTGRGAGNRQPTLSLAVIVPNPNMRSARLALAQGIAAVQQIADQQTWLLAVTPRGMLTSVLTCYRGKTVVTWNGKQQDQLVAYLTVTFQTYPYSASPQRLSITTAPPTVIEGFDSAPATTTGGSWTVDTTHYTQSPGSAEVFLGNLGSGSKSSSATWSITATDLSGGTSLLLDVAASVDSASGTVGSAGASFTVMFTSAGSTYSTPPIPCPTVRQRPGTVPVFQTVTVPLPSLAALTAVTQITVVATVQPSGSVTGSPYAYMWFDYLRTPQASQPVGIANGGIYKIPGVLGTARAPFQLQLSNTATPILSALVHHAPPEARPDYTPVIPYGSRGAAVGSTVAMPTRTDVTVLTSFSGSHAIWLGGVVLSGSGTVTVTCTFHNGDTANPQATPVMVARNCGPSDVVNGMLLIGPMTLPGRAVPADNTAATVTWTVQVSGGSSTVQDILALDTRGQTAVILATGGYQDLWIDEPAAATGVGQLLAGTTRGSASAAYDNTSISGGPMSLDPGDNLLTVYSPQGAPVATATYAPRWQAERLQ